MLVFPGCRIFHVEVTWFGMLLVVVMTVTMDCAGFRWMWDILCGSLLRLVCCLLLLRLLWWIMLVFDGRVRILLVVAGVSPF